MNNKTISLYRRFGLYTLLAASFLIQMVTRVHAYAPLAFLAPYDRQLMLPRMQGDRNKAGSWIQYGNTAHCRNIDGDKTNVLRVYNPTESSINMLREPVGDVIGKVTPLATQLFSEGATDDCGRIKLNGDIQAWEWTPNLSVLIPWCGMAGQLYANFYLPIRDVRVHNVTFTDLTAADCIPGDRVHQLLSGDIVKNAAALGDIILGNERSSGAGDLVCTLEWRSSFAQTKEHLENVNLYAHIGVLIPTSKQTSIDHPLRMALGADGAWGMPLALGIDLDFCHTISVGGSVQFLILFDTTRERRLKTHFGQTDFLLLNKARATKEHGLTWNFTLYAQSRHFVNGLSAMAGYNYIKHDDDRLLAKADDFNYAVVNSAKQLQEWNMHYLFFQLNYDVNHNCCTARVRPQFSLFYRHPLIGKGVINPGIFGGQIALDF